MILSNFKNLFWEINEKRLDIKKVSREITEKSQIVPFRCKNLKTLYLKGKVYPVDQTLQHMKPAHLFYKKILGKKISAPITIEAIARIKTAPAAKSFVCLMASRYSGETKSHRYSIAVLTASAASTIPMANTIAIHSNRSKPNKNPAAITHIAIKQ